MASDTVKPLGDLMNSIRRRRLTAVAALVLAVALSAPVPAQAAEATMSDPRDAQYGIDIKSTTLTRGTPPGYYRVTVRGYNFRQARLNAVVVFFDTVQSDTGPEYVLEWALPKDGDGVNFLALARIGGWGGQGGTELACELPWPKVNYDTEVVKLWVPRTCLGRPAKVRWNVLTWNILEHYEDGSWYGYYDAVPSWRRFGPWVG